MSPPHTGGLGVSGCGRALCGNPAVPHDTFLSKLLFLLSLPLGVDSHCSPELMQRPGYDGGHCSVVYWFLGFMAHWMTDGESWV